MKDIAKAIALTGIWIGSALAVKFGCTPAVFIGTSAISALIAVSWWD